MERGSGSERDLRGSREIHSKTEKGRRAAARARSTRHDDKSSAREKQRGWGAAYGHPSETQSFPISRAWNLKNVAKKGGTEKRGEASDGARSPVNYCRDAAARI